MFEKINKALGREAHTPATYDAAGHEAHQTKKEFQGALGNEAAREMLGPREYLKWVGKISRKAENAMSKWRSIYERGIGEAHDLNKKHETLMEEAKKALANLAQFEINELGVQEDLQGRKEKIAEELAK